MVHRAIGVLVIFVGILFFFAGLNTVIQLSILEQIPLIGMFVAMITADDMQSALLHLLLGLVLIFFGYLMVRRKKN